MPEADGPRSCGTPILLVSVKPSRWGYVRRCSWALPLPPPTFGPGFTLLRISAVRVPLSALAHAQPGPRLAHSPTVLYLPERARVAWRPRNGRLADALRSVVRHALRSVTLPGRESATLLSPAPLKKGAGDGCPDIAIRDIDLADHKHNDVTIHDHDQLTSVAPEEQRSSFCSCCFAP